MEARRNTGLVEIKARGLLQSKPEVKYGENVCGVQYLMTLL
jgi:hypothetical protein